MDISAAIDRAPLLEGLKEVSENAWSGLLRVYSAENQVGVIVLNEGRIAWAVSEDQTENLGSFLYRLGKISKQQLTFAEELYRQRGKTQKLGTILEELDLVSPEVLRQCLLLHIRHAIFHLLADPRLTVEVSGGELTVEENTTFTIGEILSPQEDHEDLQARNHIFAELAQIPGYRATIVADIEGRPLLVHGANDDESLVLHCASLPVIWLQSARNEALGAKMGPIEFAFFEFAKGAIVVRWIGEETRFLVAIYLDKIGKVGMAKHRLNLATPALEAYIIRKTHAHAGDDS